MQKFKLIIPASLKYSESVRMFASEVIDDAGGFEKRDLNMIKLVIDELFMNAIRYGSEKGSTVLLEGVFKEGEVLFAIEDEGKGVNKVTAEQLKEIIEGEKANTDLKKTHGRGLAQITGVMTTTFDVKDGNMGGIRVEFSKKAGDSKVDLLTKKKATKKKVSNEKAPLEIKEFDLEGEIDLTNMEEVCKSIDEYVDSLSYSTELVLNCKNLKYFNSTFIGKIASWYTVVNSFGGKVIIVDANDEIFSILDLVGMSGLLTFKH